MRAALYQRQVSDPRQPLFEGLYLGQFPQQPADLPFLARRLGIVFEMGHSCAGLG